MMLELVTTNLPRVLLSSLVLLAGWVVCLYGYRLTLHPLAKFPGPKLAAATRWYEFYYDVVLKGQYIFHLPELHKKYGPIIRISPDELHIDDPDFFDMLYARSGRLHKHTRDQWRFGSPNSLFATADAGVHRIRRTALNPFFSKRSVVTFQHVVREKVDQMIRNISAYRGTKTPLAINSAYMAMTGDVIMQYCFGYDFNHVDSEGFETNFHQLLLTASQSGSVGVHLPIVIRMILSLPEWFVVWSTPMFALLFKLNKSVARDVKEIKQKEDELSSKTDLEHPNVIQFLIRSDLPREEKSDQRLIDEGANFMGAGVSTTGWALTVGTFHILRNRSVFQRLRNELEVIIPDPKALNSLEWSKLEPSPYLTACIKESIRLTYANSTRLTRLSDNVIEYDQWQIPPHSAVGMSIFDVSHNESIFPDSRSFKPERWLGDARTKTGERVEKYWIGFSRGNRNCIGVNLAWMMLYMGFAGIFRNFDFELYQTDESDVELKHDFMVPSPKLDSKGVRVLVR